MGNYLIYGLVDPRTKLVRYVGQSSRGLRRPRAHGYTIPLRRKTHTANWINQLRGLGLDYEIVILEFVDRSRLDEAEIWWIKFGRCLGWELTNHATGGSSGGHNQSDAAKKKIQEKMKVRIFTPEHRARISAAKRGVPNSPEHNQKVALANIGKRASPETRRKISEANKGRKLNALQIETLARYRNRERGPQSEETKQKRADSLRAYWTSNRLERRANDKINQDIADTIRRLYATGNYTHQELANQFEVNRVTITNVLNFKTWFRK